MDSETVTKPNAGAERTQASLHALFGKEQNVSWPRDQGATPLSSHVLKNRIKQQQKLEKTACLANRMSRLLEVLPGGVVVLDGNGFVQQCNSAAVNLLGVPLDGELWAMVIRCAFSSTESDSHDVALKDGRLLHVSTSPLDGEPGQIVLLHDVTETRQLQLKVSHLQRLSAMGEMAARLAHQIRTPLSSALLYIAPLLKQGTDKKTQLRFAQKLHSSISHMERLVKDMLAFSRGDMAKTEPVSIKEILEAVGQQFYNHSDSDKFIFEIHDSTDDSYVYGSKDALSSALNNLVNNSRLACADGGDITIYAEQVEDEDGVDCIEISVEDNGVGIPEQEQSRILKPFYTTRSSGTGLGLAVVQSIVTAHRGTLWFASDEGEGSTFSLRLPMYQSVDNFTLKLQKQ
ncbi:MAG: ATP-binding protein [Gammaproteobacteria bacterium]|nr:ATP-binding protein [Gammaproteobacteria bacterium]